MKQKKKPERTCIVCRKKFEKRDLLRIVKDKEGNLHYDPTGKMNGRGAYICSDPHCIDKFMEKNLLNRTFKTNFDNEQIKNVKDEILENFKAVSEEDMK